jgi:hypothetical protein
VGVFAISGSVFIRVTQNLGEDSMKLVSNPNLVARRVFTSILAASAFAVALPQAGFAQADPVLGTWKLNLAKSTYAPGQAPRSLTVTYQGAGANLTATADTIDAAGNAAKAVFVRIYDGQPHPTTGSPDYDASAYTRVDANIYIISRTKAGRFVEVDTQVLSQDGRTNTITTRGITAAGQPTNIVQVYDKQ